MGKQHLFGGNVVVSHSSVYPNFQQKCLLVLGNSSILGAKNFEGHRAPISIITRWRFQTSFIFTNTYGEDSVWLLTIFQNRSKQPPPPPPPPHQHQHHHVRTICTGNPKHLCFDINHLLEFCSPFFGGPTASIQHPSTSFRGIISSLARSSHASFEQVRASDCREPRVVEARQSSKSSLMWNLFVLFAPVLHQVSLKRKSNSSKVWVEKQEFKEFQGLRYIYWTNKCIFFRDCCFTQNTCYPKFKNMTEWADHWTIDSPFAFFRCFFDVLEIDSSNLNISTQMSIWRHFNHLFFSTFPNLFFAHDSTWPVSRSFLEL